MCGGGVGGGGGGGGGVGGGRGCGGGGDGHGGCGCGGDGLKGGDGGGHRRPRGADRHGCAEGSSTDSGAGLEMVEVVVGVMDVGVRVIVQVVVLV